ncbi:MAG: D-tyrosyl-tRNA(Tyr) deacylase [Deltaproteobacteria bacterium]|jgi:D-tyrosyl-tRNA(Tyr) deacylase|nr:D-tyrosyl-tRNA(Tyr) deacylase [Deltaproteobacteria bacterium]
MKALLQRVKRAKVSVEDEILGSIGPGLLVLLGVAKGDTRKNAENLADKTINLRIFEDENAKMNLSALEMKLEVLVISQFTLLADTRRGRRPSFAGAAPSPEAEELYEHYAKSIEEHLKVAKGRFGAMMDVELINDGPVTIMLEDPLS